MQLTVLGAGRSAGFLIEYLTELVLERNFPRIWVIDRAPFSGFQMNEELKDCVNWLVADLEDDAFLDNVVETSDIIVSLLPVSMHLKVAKLCLKHGKHLATASYVSEGMKALHSEAESKGLVFLNEMGLDPGIDHLSSSEMLKEINQWGGQVLSYESYCGGLVNMESEKNPNPWGYKFSWNPRNVVLAGQGGESVWLQDGSEFRVEPLDLFNHSKSIKIPGSSSTELDAYPNRDSLSYRDIYKLHSAKTLVRGTLRRTGYCSAWQCLVYSGFTSPEKNGENQGSNWFFRQTGFQSSEDWTKELFNADKIDESTRLKLNFLKLDEAVHVGNESNADVLERILVHKWKLEESDRDEVIMYHSIQYLMNERWYKMSSVMTLVGEGNGRTAMAKSVGLTLAIGVELLINNEIAQKGVVVPIFQPWGLKVLEKLKKFGIEFEEFIELNPQ
jgi:saccharopine dehydrogenase-like NADP-dependent oxidoreductase